MSALLFDIGGTNLRSALLTEDGIEYVERVPTPKRPEDAVAILSARGTFERAVGGVPSTVDRDGNLLTATNLSAWVGFSFDEELEKALGAHVTLYNDAELAGLGEAVYGAGKEFTTVAYLGLGTGVGTALVKEKSIVPNMSGGDGRAAVMTLGNGIWAEDCVGGRKLEEEFNAHPSVIERAVWVDRASLVAQVVRNMIEHWSPNVVVITGSLLNDENGFRFTDIVEMVGKSTVPIVRGQLKDEAGLWGARALIAE